MSSAPTLHKFLVYAPDKTDQGAFERRLSVRAKHFEDAAKLLAAGHVLVGGAMLTPESITGGDRKMTGSVVIYEAENIETVRGWIEADVYYTAGVWDLDRLVIAPFLAATPFP
ncbi:hypothetical protein C8R46DRAFT_291402 [Mycena filopes]|nr:hypothetical protein C8R46DRAFT_291402 [Mycena filopes]